MILSRYDFVGVLQWFAERVDRIILLFDANKLDISDEFRRSIESIHGYEDKVRLFFKIDGTLIELKFPIIIILNFSFFLHSVTIFKNCPFCCLNSA